MKNRFLLAALLLAVMLLASCAVALADDTLPPPDQISPDLHFSIFEWRRNIMPFAEDIELEITRTVAAINKTSSTSISVRGVTEANKICSSIGGIMIVEQWKNNDWNEYDVIPFVAANTYISECIDSVTVEAGYYYRLVVYHTAECVAEHVSKVTNTKSIN